MRKHLWFWLSIITVSAALVASAILLVDYVRPAPVFCDPGGGCERVKQTIFARPFGVPMPSVGMVGMLALALAALVPGRHARLAQALLAAGAAIVGITLIGVQALMHVFCPFCAVVDGAAIVLSGLSLARWHLGLDPPAGWRITGGTLALLVVATIVPLVIGFRARIIPAALPAVIAEEIHRTGPGKVTVIDFVDFECPFCRMTHADLAPLLEDRKAKLRVVRRHVPLRLHPHALDAAKAGCCGENLGKGDAIADALFRAPPEELTAEGCEKIAKEVGLDADRFRACVQDPATQARIDHDREVYRAADCHGLPTIFVDATRLEGAKDKQVLEATLDTAIRAL